MIERTIDIDAPLWFRVLDRGEAPPPRPQPRPFDLQGCLDRLALITGKPAEWYDWHLMDIGPVLVPEEAGFWFRAMIESRRAKSLEALLAALTDHDRAALSFTDIVKAIQKCPRYPPRELDVPLINLLSPGQVLDLILGGQLHDSVHPYVPGADYDHLVDVLVAALRDHVLIYMDEPQRDVLRDRLRRHFRSSQGPVRAWCLAAYLKMRKELRAFILSRNDDEGFSNVSIPHLLLGALGDPLLSAQQARRFRHVQLTFSYAPAANAEYAGEWLLYTQWHALDHIRDGILACGGRREAEPLMAIFCRAHAPESAPFMLELKLESRVPAQATAWLEANPDHAIAGLVPVTAGRGKLADAAIEYLREARRKGHTALIEEQLAQVGTDIADKVRREVLSHVEKVYQPFDATTTPEWLRTALAAPGKSIKLPDWANAARLPPLAQGVHRLSEAQVQTVLAALRRSASEPCPLARALKENLDSSSLDAFAWKLFEQWLGANAPAKEKWALTALGQLGGDAIVLRLVPLLRQWPGEGQHQRAVTGLECLRAIGTDIALMQLNGIAQKLRYPGLKAKAQELMQAIAGRRQLSREELEDRIVPDLGLDEKGGRVFDFGPRQFHLVVSADLKPMVREADGKPRADLPIPAAKDDADKAAATVAEWKLLKKQFREVVKVQVHRLEQAMATGRRWQVGEFEKLLLGHPLMIHLVSRLLWGRYDAQGRLLHAFRIGPGRTYTDSADEPCDLEGAVGIVHPLHLEEEERSAWLGRFEAHHIIPPFVQLTRTVYRLRPAEASANDLRRWQGRTVPAVTVASALENNGWQRSDWGDHGFFGEYAKRFPAAGITAVVVCAPGLSVSPRDSAEQTLERCYFTRDVPGGQEVVAAGSVDPVIISEVLRELAL